MPRVPPIMCNVQLTHNHAHSLQRLVCITPKGKVFTGDPFPFPLLIHNHFSPGAKQIIDNFPKLCSRISPSPAPTPKDSKASSDAHLKCSFTQVHACTHVCAHTHPLLITMGIEQGPTFAFCCFSDTSIPLKSI